MKSLKQTNDEIKRLIAIKVEIIKNGHSFTGVPFHLHALILRFTGQDFLPGCRCQDMMSKMEEWGPAGCREHLEEIVDKLQKEGQKRGLTNALLSSVPLISRDGMRCMVIVAINLAEHGEEECRTPERIEAIVEEVEKAGSVAHVLPGWRATITMMVSKMVQPEKEQLSSNP